MYPRPPGAPGESPPVNTGAPPGGHQLPSAQTRAPMYNLPPPTGTAAAPGQAPPGGQGMRPPMYSLPPTQPGAGAPSQMPSVPPTSTPAAGGPSMPSGSVPMMRPPMYSLPPPMQPPAAGQAPSLPPTGMPPTTNTPRCNPVLCVRQRHASHNQHSPNAIRPCASADVYSLPPATGAAATAAAAAKPRPQPHRHRLLCGLRCTLCNHPPQWAQPQPAPAPTGAVSNGPPPGRATPSRPSQQLQPSRRPLRALCLRPARCHLSRPLALQPPASSRCTRHCRRLRVWERSSCA